MGLAKQVGWTPALGMAGPQSEVTLLGKMGVTSQYNQGATADSVSREVQAGRPVILDTPNHYYAIDDYNPKTDQYHVGGSGLALRGGSEWMSWDQISDHGQGVRGSITVDPSVKATPENLAAAPAAPPQGQRVNEFRDFVDKLGPVSKPAEQPPAEAPPAPAAPTPFADMGGGYTNPPPAQPAQGGLPDFGALASQALGTVKGALGMNGQPAAPTPSPGFSLGYNDMAGASSGASPALGPRPMTDDGAPAGIQAGTPNVPAAEPMPSAGQALVRGVQGASTLARGELAREADIPGIGQYPAKALLAGTDAYGQAAAANPMTQAQTPQLGTLTDQPAREQAYPVGRIQNMYGESVPDIRGGFTPSQVQAQNEQTLNMAMGAQGIEKIGADVGPNLAKSARGWLAEFVAKTVAPKAEQAGGFFHAADTASPEAEAAAARTFYHGTPSAYDRPDAMRFDPTGRFGPGYYLTSDARIAGGIVDDSGKVLSEGYAKGAAPNVRAVSVPSNFKMFDADAPVSATSARRLSDLLPTGARPRFDQAVFADSGRSTVNPDVTGRALYESLWTARGGANRIQALPEVNQLLSKAGYDGIAYQGAKSMTAADGLGSPIAHDAIVVFPESMPKLTNKISGAMGGQAQAGAAVKLASGAGGAYAGYQSDPNASPEDRARNALIGGALGATAGHVLTGGKLGLGIADITKDAGADRAGFDAAMEAKLTGKAAPEAAATDAGGTTPPSVPPASGAIPTPENPNARAGNILLRKYASPDVHQMIADAAAKDPAGMEAARRGVLPDAAVQDLANAAGTTINKVIARWKPGDAQNAETITAMRSALQGKSGEVDQLARVADASNSPADQLKLQVAVREQAAIQEAVSGVTAEAGRSLRSFRSTVQSAIASGDQSQMAAILNRNGGGQAWTADLAKKLTQLAPDDVQGRYDLLRNAVKPTLKNDLTFLWYNSMLSGPHTLAVKTTSETLMLALAPVERGAAALVEGPLAALQGRAPERFMGEAPATVVGMVGGIREGVAKALYVMQHGYSMADVLGSDYLRSGRTHFSPGVERVLGTPSNILVAGADMFRSINAAGAAQSGAYRIAKMEGLAGDALTTRIAELRATPTPALAKYAKQEGDYRVMQKEPDNFLQKALALRNAEIKNIPVGRILVPFLQTPVNLLKMGMERSPMGIFNVALNAEKFAAKDPAMSDIIGKSLMGSSIGAALALEVGAGNITGAGPASPAEADAWRRVGKTPYSLRVGDKWIAYNRLEPLNQTLGQVASIVNSINTGQDPTTAVEDFSAGMAANFVSQPYMQSLATFMGALKDPKKMSLFVDSLASSTIPAAARVVAQDIDPTVRQTSGPLEAMQADVPGMSQNLPPRLDAFGQERGRLTSNISPIGVSQVNTSPVDTELTKYGVEPGFTGKTLRGIDLNRQEMADHQRIAGQNVKVMLTQLIGDPRYTQLDALGKAHALQYVITQAKDQAANQYVGQLVDKYGRDALLQRIQQKKAQRLPAAS